MIDGERFRLLLNDERNKVTGLITSLQAEITSASASRRAMNLDEPDPEGASTIFEISQESSLLTLQEDLLDEIDAALTRLDEGTYGTCLECGQPVPEGRLEARPWTAYCIDHATSHRRPSRHTNRIG